MSKNFSLPWILPKVPRVDCKAYSVPQGCQDQTLQEGFAKRNSPNGEAVARKANIVDPWKDRVQDAFQDLSCKF